MTINQRTVDTCDDIHELYGALDRGDHGYFKDWILNDYLNAKNWVIGCIGIAPWHEWQRDKRAGQLDRELAFAQANGGVQLSHPTLAETERRSEKLGQLPPPMHIEGQPPVSRYAIFLCVRLAHPDPTTGMTDIPCGPATFRERFETLSACRAYMDALAAQSVYERHDAQDRYFLPDITQGRSISWNECRSAGPPPR